MTHNNYQPNKFSVKLPITQAVRHTAQKFARQQPNTTKAEQVKLNTVAVSVVNDYLTMLGMSTNLEASDSWNSIVRLFADVADLEVTSIGRIECRPVTSQQQTCPVPPETWEDRVGYVVVEIDDQLQEAHILGFARQVNSEELSLNKLQPVETLIDHLHRLTAAPIQPLVDLSQWFNGVVEAGWQTIESLLDTQTALVPAFRSAFRGGVSILERNVSEQVEQPSELIIRAKVIDVNTATYNDPLLLIVEISPEANQRTCINLQLHAAGNEVYLPVGINLTILDHLGTVFLEAKARKQDNYIQLEFAGDPQERFTVQVTLDHTLFLGNFTI